MLLMKISFVTFFVSVFLLFILALFFEAPLATYNDLNCLSVGDYVTVNGFVTKCNDYFCQLLINDSYKVTSINASGFVKVIGKISSYNDERYLEIIRYEKN